ncbi:MAG: serine hydrolase domain-containing protein, partial [Bacteroidota bacterium]
LKALLHREGKWYKKKNFLKAQPGTQNRYTNLNAALAAYLVEIASGMSFIDFSQQFIFNPLNLKDTGWEVMELDTTRLATRYFPAGNVVPPYRLNSYPDGGLYSSVSDMAHFLQEMIKAYRGESEYLPQSYAHLLFPGDTDDYRAFWGMNETIRNIGHTGSDPGVETEVRFNADSHMGYVMFTNVNAEDNDDLWTQYKALQAIVVEQLQGKK